MANLLRGNFRDAVTHHAILPKHGQGMHRAPTEPSPWSRLKKINIRDLPLSGKLQSDLIQSEHRTPGVGVENGITPCRLSACSMLSSVEATLVGGLLPLFSQYRTDRGRHPAARARSACVSPASIRAA